MTTDKRRDELAEETAQKEWDYYQEHLKIGGKQLHVRSFVRLGFEKGWDARQSEIDSLNRLHATVVESLQRAQKALITEEQERYETELASIYSQITKLEAQLKVAVDALEQYADGRAFDFDRHMNGQVLFRMALSQVTAKRALAKIEEMKK